MSDDVIVKLVLLAVSAAVVPSVAWLIREVLAIRNTLVALQTRLEAKDRDCDRHQRWSDGLQRSMNRTERNVARLCQAMGVQPEGE